MRLKRIFIVACSMAPTASLALGGSWKPSIALALSRDAFCSAASIAWTEARIVALGGKYTHGVAKVTTPPCCRAAQ